MHVDCSSHWDFDLDRDFALAIFHMVQHFCCHMNRCLLFAWKTFDNFAAHWNTVDTAKAVEIA